MYKRGIRLIFPDIEKIQEKWKKNYLKLNKEMEGQQKAFGD